MIVKLASSILILISMLIFYSSSPVVIVVRVVVNTILITLVTFIYTSSSIISYILFLIFLGALIILFIYVCRLARNEPIFFNSPSYPAIVVIALAVFTLWLVNYQEINQLPTHWNLSYLYFRLSTENFLYTLAFLLITLFVCVSLCINKEGALRTKKY